MQEAMQCLEQELKESPADSKAHRILVFMVEKKLEDLARGVSEPQVFSRSSLHLNIEGANKARNGDAARWLKPQLLESYLESRQSALINRLEHAGVDVLPIIRTEGSKGGKGIERTYWLDVEALSETDDMEEQERDFRQIIYRRSETGEVKPSLPLRLIFRQGQLKNRSWRGVLLFGVFLTGLLLWLAWFLLGIWGVADFEKALSLRQLGLTALLILCSWIIWAGTYRPWIRLVDERVVKATTGLVAMFEDSAEIEMHRDSQKHQWTRFVRFSGDCPICGGRVLLAEGKPDHKLPLVGRCGESPYAHVFSFDRVRLKGTYLGPDK